MSVGDCAGKDDGGRLDEGVGGVAEKLNFDARVMDEVDGKVDGSELRRVEMDVLLDGEVEGLESAAGLC